ncbi:hypothetical protein ASC66_11050 [Leifsonia sp. Root4]|uniref:hypothetical protein n=1 Tax=Leifsonia sp. Root4 TaxID=1736525 RepID=UPI0006F45872|nr:hypothetical protein [Leifsonia sp. Root4]KQW05526.1 hypothetical protein ASC66_11050 [Leifsonia sp. Root4]
MGAVAGSDVHWVVDPVTQEEIAVPPYASAEQAIRRAAMKRSGRLRFIRMFPDYGRDYPLWENGSGNYTVTAADLELSTPLADALRRWQQRWDDECLDSSEWSSEQARLDWLRDGAEMCARLQREVWDFAEVLPEFGAG